MPELIQNGPDIPVELMNRRDAGKVVFFCGAGISVPTGLPDFRDLVSNIHKHIGVQSLDVEQDILFQDLLCKGQYDKALGLLEGCLNQGCLRRMVIDILSVSPPSGNSLDAHKALLYLSRTADNTVRLVTTNFDDRFERAFERAEINIPIDRAPLLPLPKPHDWKSLVYMHGRIDKKNDADGRNLVLTAADIGRAYLTERWASRFITELFREFTVVFVGYSLNDPVMTYMVDALAAERAQGAGFQKAYAFADHNGSKEGRKKSERSWHGKNIIPIPFDCSDNFQKLTETLVKWAEDSRDPIKNRTQIVSDELQKMPANADDPAVKRVVWALSDKTAAKALAEKPPVSDENDFPIIAEWLEVFDEAGLLSRPNDNGEHRTPLAGSAFIEHTAQWPDGVTYHLERWLTKNLHIPQVLGWAGRKDGHLHPCFRRLVHLRLAGQDGSQDGATEIPERLRILWTVLVQNNAVDHQEDRFLSYFVVNATSDDERFLLEDALVASLRPRLLVRPGPSNRSDINQSPLSPLEECAHLVLAEDKYDHRQLGEGELRNRNRILAAHAFVMTEHLRHAIHLLALTDEGSNDLLLFRGAIERHEQNFAQDDWHLLIDWARDGYFALAERRRLDADILFRIWTESDLPLLRRLALHAATEDPAADIDAAVTVLLTGDPTGIWSIELHHEVMVFLRKAGNRLPQDKLGELVKVIVDGPPLAGAADDKAERDQTNRSTALRLSKLAASGAVLDDNARQLAETYRSPECVPEESDEFLVWSGSGGEILNAHDFIRTEWRQGGPPIDELFAGVRDGTVRAGEFANICDRWPGRALRTLRKLTKINRWPADYWRGLLELYGVSQREAKPRTRAIGYIASLLSEAPPELYSQANASIATIIHRLSQTCPVEHEREFRDIWERAWRAGPTSQDDEIFDDALTMALNRPAGRLAKAAFERLSKYQPQQEASNGLPDAVKSYFELIVEPDADRSGRVMVALRLSYLFAIDPEWTQEWVLPYMKWDRPDEEASGLWAAYAASARAGPNLLAAIKDDFLEALSRFDELGCRRAKLLDLFIAADLELKTMFSTEEIQKVVSDLPKEGLVRIAGYFERFLDGTDAERAEAWKNKCHPWLAIYWPKLRDRHTSGTSRALVYCLINTGDAFPCAFRWAQGFLREGADKIIRPIKESRIHTRWPDELLEMLKNIMPDGNIEPGDAYELKGILDEMEETTPTITQNPIFQRLYRTDIQ